jgi:hypothetical protein
MSEVYNRNSHFGTRVVVVPGWCWDLGCQACDLCDLCEACDFCAKLAVAPRGRTYSRFRPTTFDRAHHHHVRKFYRVRDALDHHRGGDKSAFSTRCDGGVQHQPSRLPAPRRGSPSGRVGRLDTTRPQTSHVSLAFCQLSAHSRCCSRSRRASPVLHAHTCAARPPRGSEALFGGDTSCCATDSGQPRDPAKGILRLTGPTNQNGRATLASPARRLPETCAHRTVAYMCQASERQQPVRFRCLISAPHTPADHAAESRHSAHRADTGASHLYVDVQRAAQALSSGGEN